MFARDAGAPPPERLAWLCDDLNDFVSQAGPRSALVLSAAVRLATWVAPVMVGRRPPLSRLTVDERCNALARLEGSPAGLSILALKAMLCLLYYEHPEAQREVGLDNNCLGRRTV